MRAFLNILDFRKEKITLESLKVVLEAFPLEEKADIVLFESISQKANELQQTDSTFKLQQATFNFRIKAYLAALDIL